MKNISQIINLIKTKNEFTKLKNSSSFDKLLNVLPPNISNGIDFMYTKNNTLFFVLKHQVFKSECEYNRVTIKNLLTLIPEIKATELVFIVTNKPKLKPKEDEIVNQNYEERSNAMFENSSKTKEYYEIFEEIRSCIKRNRDI